MRIGGASSSSVLSGVCALLQRRAQVLPEARATAPSTAPSPSRSPTSVRARRRARRPRSGSSASAASCAPRDRRSRTPPAGGRARPPGTGTVPCDARDRRQHLKAVVAHEARDLLAQRQARPSPRAAAPRRAAPPAPPPGRRSRPAGPARPTRQNRIRTRSSSADSCGICNFPGCELAAARSRERRGFRQASCALGRRRLEIG